MSMRALWAVLFVLAPLAAVAGYGSTYGVTSMGGAGGGGVTVGDAVSGGTNNRVLVKDASGNVATPDLLRVDLTNGRLGISRTADVELDVGVNATGDSTLHLRRTADTDTTFTTWLTNDTATPTNPSWSLGLRPSTSGSLTLQSYDGSTSSVRTQWDTSGHITQSGNLRVDGTSDLRGAISNGGSGTCGATGLGTGALCLSDSSGYVFEGPNADFINTLTVAGSSYSKIDLRSYTSARGEVHTTASGLAVRASTAIWAGSTGSVAAGTAVFQVVEGSTLNSAGTVLASFDGSGNLFLNAAATRSKGTITLAAGTGTATVASGSVCVCASQTANYAYCPAVSGTTLTANGTGTDVVAYHCL